MTIIDPYSKYVQAYDLTTLSNIQVVKAFSNVHDIPWFTTPWNNGPSNRPEKYCSLRIFSNYERKIKTRLITVSNFTIIKHLRVTR